MWTNTPFSRALTHNHMDPYTKNTLPAPALFLRLRMWLSAPSLAKGEEHFARPLKITSVGIR